MNKPVAKKPVVRKPAVKKPATKLVESKESVQTRALVSKLNGLGEEDLKNILANSGQKVFDAVMTVAAESTPSKPKAELMPWRALVNTFIDNRYFAEEAAKRSLARCQSLITKEFRTLIIGGCRQTGKTQLARSLVLGNPKARLIHAPYPNLVPKENQPLVRERTIDDINALRSDTMHKDVELLVINQDGFSFEKRNPYMELLNCLEDDPNKFPPEMQVIWII